MWDDYLFHYTDAAAILNIVRTRTIWASDISFLNDGFEGKLLSKIIAGIADRPEVYGVRERNPLILGALREHLRWGKEYFVASFSKRPDMLTQFRMYCPPEGGFVIGFPRNYLERASELGDIEYELGNHRAWCVDYANRFLSAAASVPSDGKTSSDVAYAVLCTAAWHEERAKAEVCCKSNEFATELEVRMIKTGAVKRLVRPSRNRNIFVPYVEIELPNEEVLIKIAPGPGRYRELAQSSVSNLATVARDSGTLWQIGILGIGEFGYRDI